MAFDYLSITSPVGNRSAAENTMARHQLPTITYRSLSVPSLGSGTIPSLPPKGGEGGRESNLPGLPSQGKTSPGTITYRGGNRSRGDVSLPAPSPLPPASLPAAPLVCQGASEEATRARHVEWLYGFNVCAWRLRPGHRSWCRGGSDGR